MPGTRFHACTPAIALAAATAKTVWHCLAGSNIVYIEEFEITFDGVTAAAVPVLVELCTYTASGTGTTLTPQKFDSNNATASGATLKYDHTVEPGGTTTMVRSAYIHGQAGRWNPKTVWPVPAAARFGIRCTAAAIVNCRVYCSLME